MWVLSLIFIMSIVIIACSNSTSSDDDDEIEVMLTEVRNAVSSYKNFEAGVAAGWGADISGCIEHPEEGGMGYHFARMEYFDGRINHVQPQVLLYEPTENGGFELVGVEYIIPFEILSDDSEAPELFGQQYHRNHELGIWALHVWTEKENPKGMFYDWNPDVTCQYAADE